MNETCCYHELEHAIGRTSDPRRRTRLHRNASWVISLVDQAIDLGLAERVAMRRCPAWLAAFVASQAHPPSA